ncbi:MAG: hypothetical protein FI718_03435 [SAR202 cluster bacterium]|nr:hypothetical protein [SAR202 cluster bacterium]|tara:strand:+ start:5599 stop:6891 length:1293 start_codon:yes stop_codon:yes gene_type:complete
MKLNTIIDKKIEDIYNAKMIYWVALFFSVSFLIRLILFLAPIESLTTLQGDEYAYSSMAESILNGTGWHDYAGRASYLPPLLPIILFLNYSVFDVDYNSAKILMIILASFVAPTIFAVSKTLFPNKFWISFTAAIIVTLYPPSIYYSNMLLTENAASLFVPLILLSYLSTSKTNSLLLTVISGLLWGLASLNRPVFLMLPIFMLVSQMLLQLTFKNIHWKWKPTNWIIGIIVMLITISPWTIHNFIVHENFVPIHTASGYMMLICNGKLNHPDIQKGLFYYKDEHYQKTLNDNLSEIEKDGLAMEMALSEISENWRLLPKPILNRAKNFWSWRPDPYDTNFTLNDLVMALIYIPILIFFIFGLFKCNFQNSWPAIVIILYVFITILPFWGSPRFRFPVDSLIIMMASFGIISAISIIKNKSAELVKTNPK